jgi:hypothetical protein
MADKHPIATKMRERAMFDEGHLMALLTTFQRLIQGQRYDAAKHVEYAIHAFRREEIDALACALEEHEAERIAKGSSEDR